MCFGEELKGIGQHCVVHIRGLHGAHCSCKNEQISIHTKHSMYCSSDMQYDGLLKASVSEHTCCLHDLTVGIKAYNWLGQFS